MQLDKYYSIDKDSYNFILRYKREYYDEDKGKTVTSSSESFHNTLRQAVERYYNDVVDVDQSVEELVAQISSIESQIKGINFKELRNEEI